MEPDVGTGIKRMKDSMKLSGLEEHEFIETGGFFKEIFRFNNYIKKNSQLMK